MNKTPTAAWIETPTACYLVGATHEEIEDARTNARLDAQAEYEDQIQHERGYDE